jgi:hypothetical protein
MKPNPALKAAARNAIPKLTRNAASVRGEESSAQIFAQPASLAFSSSTQSGMMTMRPR